jgi:hypothetical protein
MRWPAVFTVLAAAAGCGSTGPIDALARGLLARGPRAPGPLASRSIDEIAAPGEPRGVGG